VALFDDGSNSDYRKLGLPLLADLPWRKELAQARSIRWNALGKAVQREADDLANEVELAIAATKQSAANAAHESSLDTEVNTGNTQTIN
jgi:hypothetical protein